MFAHGYDAGCATGIAHHHGPVATAVGPHLHHLFGAAHAGCGARGAELLFQPGLHLVGGGADHLGNRAGREGGAEQEKRDEFPHIPRIAAFTPCDSFMTRCG